MKKRYYLLTATVLMLVGSGSWAQRPVDGDGFAKYKNSISLDLVSIGYMSPQIMWEHYFDSRFSCGVFVQGHFKNHSTFKDTDLSHDETYNGEKYHIKYDRRYAGVMVSPECRYYLGKRPDRGLYGSFRMDMGLFRESYDVSRAPKVGLSAQSDQYLFLRNEKGELNMGLGAGLGMGWKLWFKQNSHWGMDANCYVKYDWKMCSSNDNLWEWRLGPGLITDLNIAVIYRF